MNANDEMLAKRAQRLARAQQIAAMTDEQLIAGRDKDYCDTWRRSALADIKSINESIANDAEIDAYVKVHGTDEG
jgi:hypothetical protein